MAIVHLKFFKKKSKKIDDAACAAKFANKAGDRDTLEILPAFHLSLRLLALLMDFIRYDVRKSYFYLLNSEDKRYFICH